MPTPHLQPRKKRKWRRRLALLAGLLLALVLLAPFWTPWLARPVARRLGADFTTASRVGYWRLKLEKVRLEQPGVDIAIDEVSLLQPVGWLIERVSPGSLTSPEHPAIDVRGCQVELTEAPASAQPSRINSTAQALSAALRIARQVSAWVAHARVAEGTVRFAGQSLSVPEATWAGGSLTAEIEYKLLRQPLGIRLSLLEEPAFRIEFKHELAAASILLREDQPAEQWLLQGMVSVLGGTGDVAGGFRGKEWLPVVKLEVAGVHWPEEGPPLPEWIKPPVGQIQVLSDPSGLSVVCTVTSAIRLRETLARQVGTELDVLVDQKGMALRSFSATMPGLKIALAEPLSLPLAWPPEGASATLNIESDLSDLSDSAASGTLRGELTVTPSADELLPGAHLQLQGTNLAMADQPLGPLTLGVSFNWPELQLDRFALGDTNSSLTATGLVDLATQDIRAFHWQLTGLPAAFTNLVNLQNLAASGEISGPLSNPEQKGTLVAEKFDLPGLYPIAVRAEWAGAGLALTHFTAKASANTGELVVGGAVDANLEATAPAFNLRLGQLALLRDGQPLLALDQPSDVRIAFPRADDAAAAAGSPRIGVPELELAGDTRKLRLTGAVTWPGEGQIRTEAAGLQATDLRDFVPNVPDWIRLDRLSLDTGWTNGPVAFDLDGFFALAAIPEVPLSLTTRITSTGENIEVQSVRIQRNDQPLAEFSGELPLSLEPGHPGGLLRLHPQGKLLTRLKADQAGPLWSEVTRWFGVTTVNPSLTVTLTGTGGAPRGHVQFAADAVRSENAIGGIVVPPVVEPKFTATLDDTGKLTAAAEAKVGGQRGTFSASLPVNLAALTNSASGFKPPDLTPLQARLRLPNWQIAPLAMLAPDFLGPQGTLDLDVSVEPGLRLSGRFQATNLVTKPLPPVGVLRQMHAFARLGNDGITLESAGAMLGSQPLNVQGAWNFSTNGPPGYAFSITGTNLPLVRQQDVFLRGDLALKLTGTNLNDAIVSGEVTLRHSLFLRDLESLVSGDVEVPSARPPFFSIDQAPLADWRLDLKVAGDQFLRVVTPVFRGRVSAALQLGGTLREPVALGDVTLPSGTVTFPFGGLKVDSGRASLTRSSPFVPSISFQASGLNFGYDVRMDVSGKATAPNVLFSSVPPLSSMEILLMLTSGDIPGDAFSYSSRSRMQQIGMFVGKEFLGKLTGDPESDRLTMRSGEEVTDRGQLTYSIEYRLSPRWSLFGQRDRFDSYGAGVKWRVFSK